MTRLRWSSNLGVPYLSNFPIVFWYSVASKLVLFSDRADHSKNVMQQAVAVCGWHASIAPGASSKFGHGLLSLAESSALGAVSNVPQDQSCRASPNSTLTFNMTAECPSEPNPGLRTRQ